MGLLFICREEGDGCALRGEERGEKIGLSLFFYFVLTSGNDVKGCCRFLSWRG